MKKIVFRTSLGLFASIVGLIIIGQMLPRPTPPAIGKLITLPNGEKINTYQKGKGQSVVLVHGLPGSADDWIEFVDALVERGFHVVWYDRIGYGHSSRRAKDTAHTMQANGHELDMLIATLGLKNPALIGWSFGGGSIQASNASRNKNTPFIVLLAAVGPAMQMKKSPLDFPGGPLLLSAPILGKLLTQLTITTLFNDPIPNRWAENTRALLLIPGTVDTMRAEMSQMNPADLKGDIDTPALLIHGRQDRLVVHEVSEALLASLGNAKLETLEKAGHMLPMSYPNKIADMIQSFAISQNKSVHPSNK